MNLMFWKKKNRAGEDEQETPADAEPHEAHDPVAVGQEDAVPSPEQPDTEEGGGDMPGKPGLAMRARLQFAALLRRFRKASAPDAEEDQAHDAENDEPPATEAQARPGLFLRLRAGFAAFSREFKSSDVPVANENRDMDSRGHSGAAQESEHPEGEAEAGPARSRKRLIVGAAALLILLLIGIGFVVWPALTPPEERRGTRHDLPSATPRSVLPEHATVESQSDIEALRRRNAELQARIEALRQEQPQMEPQAQPRLDIPAAPQAGSNPPSLPGGEMAVGTNDPRATAMTLKEAIEAMNASSGDHDRNRAK